MYYRGAAAAIVVYDITQANSFKTLKNWVDELKTKGPKDIAIAIAGNKADLEHLRVSHKDNFALLFKCCKLWAFLSFCCSNFYFASALVFVVYILLLDHSSPHLSSSSFSFHSKWIRRWQWPMQRKLVHCFWRPVRKRILMYKIYLSN